MARDFTLTKYKELCNAVADSEYEQLLMRDYLLGKKPTGFIMLRHDVDVSAKKALNMARLENELGVKSTYYFRVMPGIFEPEIIQEIAGMGHEVGYHYEVLDKAKGNPDKAIEIFKEELSKLRKICDIKTIAMHGNPRTRWDNRDLWRDRDLKEFGLLGEAYLSVDYDKIFYFTDTGRSWGDKYTLKDMVKTRNNISLSKTDDLINLIRSKKLCCMCINTHPKRWNDSFLPWLWELVFQSTKNLGKLCIKWVR